MTSYDTRPGPSSQSVAPPPCPVCGASSRPAGSRNRRPVWRCSDSTCGAEFSTTAETAPDPPPRRPSGNPAACPGCGSTNLVAVPRSDQHHAELRCGACDRWIKFVPTPWTRERAEAFRLPYGKHKGKTVGELGRTDPDYLRWMARECWGGPATAARIVLGLDQPEEVPNG